MVLHKVIIDETDIASHRISFFNFDARTDVKFLHFSPSLLFLISISKKTVL